MIAAIFLAGWMHWVGPILVEEGETAKLCWDQIEDYNCDAPSDVGTMICNSMICTDKHLATKCVDVGPVTTTPAAEPDPTPIP